MAAVKVSFGNPTVIKRTKTSTSKKCSVLFN